MKEIFVYSHRVPGFLKDKLLFLNYKHLDSLYSTNGISLILNILPRKRVNCMTNPVLAFSIFRDLNTVWPSYKTHIGCWELASSCIPGS